MDKEEKARAYDEALERAKKLQEKSNGMILNKWLTGVFPELAESEDERIRKEIIRILKGELGYTSKEDADKYIAWLEKQGEQKYVITTPKFRVGDKVYAIKNRFECTIESIDETTYYGDTTNFDIKDQDNWKLVEQKPTDMVEPKSKVGDWVVFDNNLNGNSIYHIEKIENYHYTLRHILGGSLPLPFGNESHIRPWTIQDAKDGDVLELDCGIGIFKDRCIDGYNTHCYCYYSNEGILEINKDSLYDIYQSHPVTKEQRDLLFQKIKEAGYEWDAEKKELKKIEQKLDKCDGCNNVKGCVTCVDGDQWAHYKEVEQKPIKMWHDVSEIPYLYEEEDLLVECGTRNYVVKYNPDTKQFLNFRGFPVNGVIRWAYVSDVLSQSVTKTSDKGWSEEDEEEKSKWKDAQGDDLPQIDKVVAVLCQPYPFEDGEYIISFAHRPNPDGWDGKNISTGKIEHYTPETYGKGGWNIPNVIWWLDMEFPKKEE